MASQKTVKKHLKAIGDALGAAVEAGAVEAHQAEHVMQRLENSAAAAAAAAEAPGDDAGDLEEEGQH